ncbi:UNVERIFIED_CONTAM: hypothetical protein GTU68_014969 [Idotea baltica]|nr:hypothetical protein [Idotea baltica]
MLLELGHIPESAKERQLAAAKTRGTDFSYALLLDALQEEQRLGITIDVARASFSTSDFDIQVFDAPGHRKFLKNMVTGASRAQSALLVVDVEEGVSPGTRLHAAVLKLLGISEIAVAINKMDAVGYSQTIFEDLSKKIADLLADFGITSVANIPVSANEATNLIEKSEITSWYKGESLLSALISLAPNQELAGEQTRIYIQETLQQNETNRVLAFLSDGNIESGQEFLAYPGKERIKIDQLIDWGKSNPQNVAAPSSIAFTCDNNKALQRGTLLCSVNSSQPESIKKVSTRVLWLADVPLCVGGSYTIKIGTAEYNVVCTKLKDCFDPASDMSIAEVDKLHSGQIAYCLFSCEHEMTYDLSASATICSRFVLTHNSVVCGGGTFTD